MAFGQEVKDFITGYQAGYDMIRGKDQRDLDRAEVEHRRAQTEYLLANTNKLMAELGPSGYSDRVASGMGTAGGAGGGGGAGGAGGSFSTNDPADTSLEPHQRAFLNAIAGGESSGRYDVLNGGELFDDFSQHPNRVGRGGASGAAGRYQIIPSTWIRVREATGLRDFTPETQDKGAWWLAQQDYNTRTGRSLDEDLRERGLTPEILNTLAPTWEAFNSDPNIHIGMYNSSLSRYKDAVTTAAAVPPASGDYPLPPAIADQKRRQEEAGAIPTPATAPAGATPIASATTTTAGVPVDGVVGAGPGAGGAPVPPAVPAVAPAPAAAVPGAAITPPAPSPPPYAGGPAPASASAATPIHIVPPAAASVGLAAPKPGWFDERLYGPWRTLSPEIRERSASIRSFNDAPVDVQAALQANGKAAGINFQRRDDLGRPTGVVDTRQEFNYDAAGAVAEDNAAAGVAAPSPPPIVLPDAAGLPPGGAAAPSAASATPPPYPQPGWAGRVTPEELLPRYGNNLAVATTMANKLNEGRMQVEAEEAAKGNPPLYPGAPAPAPAPPAAAPGSLAGGAGRDTIAAPTAPATPAGAIPAPAAPPPAEAAALGPEPTGTAVRPQHNNEGGGETTAPVAQPGERYTPDNFPLTHLRPADIMGRDPREAWVDANSAIQLDQALGRFFEDTGIRVRINDPHNFTPGARGGRRRGTTMPDGSPHVENSQHHVGKAFDLQIQHLSNEQRSQLVDYLVEEGFTGFGFYGPGGHLHVDTGARRTWGTVPDWAQDAMGRRGDGSQTAYGDDGQPLPGPGAGAMGMPGVPPPRADLPPTRPVQEVDPNLPSEGIPTASPPRVPPALVEPPTAAFAPPAAPAVPRAGIDAASPPSAVFGPTGAWAGAPNATPEVATPSVPLPEPRPKPPARRLQDPIPGPGAGAPVTPRGAPGAPLDLTAPTLGAVIPGRAARAGAATPDTPGARPGPVTAPAPPVTASLPQALPVVRTGIAVGLQGGLHILDRIGLRAGSYAIGDQDHETRMRALYNGAGAAKPDDMTVIRGHTANWWRANFGRQPTDAELTAASLYFVWQDYMRYGEGDKAKEAAGEMYQYYQQMSNMYMSLAGAAGQAGDYDGMLNNMIRSYANVPDGNSLAVVRVDAQRVAIRHTDIEGKVLFEGVKSPQEIMQMISGMNPAMFGRSLAQSAGIVTATQAYLTAVGYVQEGREVPAQMWSTMTADEQKMVIDYQNFLEKQRPDQVKPLTAGERSQMNKDILESFALFDQELNDIDTARGERGPIKPSPEILQSIVEGANDIFNDPNNRDIITNPRQAINLAATLTSTAPNTFWITEQEDGTFTVNSQYTPDGITVPRQTLEYLLQHRYQAFETQRKKEEFDLAEGNRRRERNAGIVRNIDRTGRAAGAVAQQGLDWVNKLLQDTFRIPDPSEFPPVPPVPTDQPFWSRVNPGANREPPRQGIPAGPDYNDREPAEIPVTSDESDPYRTIPRPSGSLVSPTDPIPGYSPAKYSGGSGEDNVQAIGTPPPTAPVEPPAPPVQQMQPPPLSRQPVLQADGRVSVDDPGINEPPPELKDRISTQEWLARFPPAQRAEIWTRSLNSVTGRIR